MISLHKLRFRRHRSINEVVKENSDLDLEKKKKKRKKSREKRKGGGRGETKKNILYPQYQASFIFHNMDTFVYKIFWIQRFEISCLSRTYISQMRFIHASRVYLSLSHQLYISHHSKILKSYISRRPYIPNMSKSKSSTLSNHLDSILKTR